MKRERERDRNKNKQKKNENKSKTNNNGKAATKNTQRSKVCVPTEASYEKRERER